MGCTVQRVMCTFGGAGGGAEGFRCAKASLFGQEAKFELVGGFDKDEYACKAFEYLTGVPQICIDARELTPAMMREFYGEKAPFVIFGSPPCQGASKLLSTAKSKTAFYEQLNELALINTRLILETYGDDWSFVIFENVPNITSRASEMLAEMRALWIAAGAVIQDGYHECRYVGNLAQWRKRWLMVIRNPRKVPAFLYEAPNQPGQVCGDVLKDLPMPGDPRGGAMHVLPEIVMRNWLRLWAIPAGGDWRDLLPDDGTPRRARFRRNHIEKWEEPSVTIGGPGSNGPCAVADPRPEAQTRFHHVDRVTPWTAPSGTVTHSPAPSSGAIAIQDPRFRGSLGVLKPSEPSGTITTESCPSNGGFAIADQQSLLAMNLGQDAHFNLYRVTAADDAIGTITGATRPGNGAPNIADGRPLDLVPQGGGEGLHYGKYVVCAWSSASRTVVGATRVGSGAMSVAQPIELALKDSAFHEGPGIGRLGVLQKSDAASTLTGNARIATGPFSIADDVPVPLDLIPAEKCYDKGYAVIDRDNEPSHTIAGKSFVGCGTYAITDDVPEPLDLVLGCTPYAGAWGVTAASSPSPTVITEATIAKAQVAIADPKPVPPPFVVLSYEQTKLIVDGYVTAPFCIVDPAHPDVALAIVESMDAHPFRWVEVPGKIGKRGKRGKSTWAKENVPLVLISADGTWHRPLTTLELAVLQGLEWQHNGVALDFGGGSTEQRKAIGNMVPKPVGEAIAGQMLKAGLASAAGCFFMYCVGGGFWVQPEYRDELIRSGVRRVRQQDAGKIAPDEMVILDDAARPIRRRTARSKKRVTAADLIKSILARPLSRPMRAPARVSSYQVPLHAEARVLM